MDTFDRNIVNALQDGIDVCDRPFAAIAQRLAISEEDLLERVQRLLDEGVLTRFGPLFQAERLGGSLSLCAMRVPEARFEAHVGALALPGSVRSLQPGDHVLEVVDGVGAGELAQRTGAPIVVAGGIAPLAAPAL